jgi:putative membrane-bound dehydrogenase-like protein
VRGAGVIPSRVHLEPSDIVLARLKPTDSLRLLVTSIVLTCACGLAAVGPARAADSSGPASIPPPLSPAESLQKLRLPAGFRAEIVAAEPLVLDPVAFDWDERGRLWVVEMADYPLGMDGKGSAGGRVRILEDVNGDGVFDRSTLFAEGLSFPTGILTWRNGCLVTAAPDILLLKDTDGDDRADVRDPLFTGFNPGNQQLRVNGLRWGLDGWVYCANGGHHVNYGKDVSITSRLTGAKIALGARDFRFKPDTGELDPLSGPAQFGRTRDAWGNWFGVQNSYPLWHYALEDHYLRRNPHVAPPSPKVVLTDSNPRVYPAIEPEKRYHNFGQAGRFTSACSPLIVADLNVFGRRPPGLEDALVCEPMHNLVQHLIVEHAGSTFKAERAPGEATDYFASEDRWCRPVMVRTGPDGALWVADMYRYMIEHPQWLPANGQAELLPHYRAGDDKGRMYRVSKDGHRAGALPRLAGLDTASLVALLDSPNGWVRDKAQMMLQWQGNKGAVPVLERLARDTSKTLGRMHALHALEHFGALKDDILISALSDKAPGVRVQALVLAERHGTERVVAAAVALAADPDAKVRLQLACSLGAWPEAVAGEALTKLAVSDGADPVVRGAITSSLLPHLAVFAARFQGDDELLDATFQTALGERREDVILTLLGPPLAAATPSDATSLRRARAALTLLRGKGITLESLAAKHPANLRWGDIVVRKNELLATVRRAIPDAPAETQAFYATVLVCDPKEQSAALELLGQLLAPGRGLQPFGEYVGQLARIGDAGVPELLLRSWAQRTPGERMVILDAIMGREAWVTGLLDRVTEGKLSASDFDAQRQARLLKHPTAGIRRHASSVFTTTANRSRQQVIDSFKPALGLTGNVAAGKSVFAQTCASCHQLEGFGMALGPDLRSVVDHPAEKLLASILDPSADIQPGFAAYFCELTTGEQLYGSIASETGGSLSFRLADGSTRAIVRSTIKSLQSSNVSLMPEGLEASLTPQALRDLIAYLKVPK